ncbi:MAG: NAD-dependent succinate-semialdehyde dehydrogenase [Aestuariibacter sp.]
MAAEYQALLRKGSYINGQWHQSEQTFNVRDKANGNLITQVANASSEDMQWAIKHASEAFPGWSALPGKERATYLRDWFALLQEHREGLAQLLTLEQGKPIAEARGEIDYGAGYLHWFAGEAERICGDIMQGLRPGQQIQVVKKPVGVVGTITPWNFPNAMIARKAAAALAAGCTFVGRPAAETPLSALAMAYLAEKAGIPAGVFNIVTGTDAKGLGLVLTKSPQVAKFSFTGSTRVGRQLIQDCASTVKRVSMELGGNAPFIVFDDADIEAAVNGAMLAKFRNAGQTCVCANRFLVHQDVATPFSQALAKRMLQLRQGHGLENVDMGPLISEHAAANINALVKDALASGAKRQVGENWNNSVFYSPTLLNGVTPSMRIFNEEIFGPVVTITTFKTDAEAVRLANQTEYGLAAYFYSQNASRIQHIAEQLEFGMVGINDAAISNPAAPFGGVKQSGYGREGSKYGLDDYLSLQYRCVGGN